MLEDLEDLECVLFLNRKKHVLKYNNMFKAGVEGARAPGGMKFFFPKRYHSCFLLTCFLTLGHG